MINFNKSRFDRTVSRSVGSPALITAEGAALVADYTVDNGVAASAGGASEVFVGVSISQQRTLLAASHVEDVVVGASGTFSLSFPRSSNTLCRFALVAAGVETNLALTAATPGSPTAGEAEPVSGSAQNFRTNASNAGAVVRAYYRYAPTAAQAQMLQGDVLPGGDSGFLLNTVGVVVAGDVYTDQFDPSADWQAGGVLRLSAAGLFTLGGSGAALPTSQVRVISKPSVGSPYLGLSILNG